MSQLSQFFSGLIQKEQIFTASGTFTPSPRLLALGGWVEVICVGGGGGGYSYGGIKIGGGGGNVIRRIVQVTGDVTVTIGAGGTGGFSPTAGGTTSFGSLVSAAGGGGGASSGGGNSMGRSFKRTYFVNNPVYPGGIGAGGIAGVCQKWIVVESSGDYFPSMIAMYNGGGPSLRGFGYGGFGTTSSGYFPVSSTSTYPNNTGGGGCAGGNGASGICIVRWYE